MSDAISLLSALTGVTLGGLTAKGAAATGFEALFQLDGAGAGLPDTEAANGSGADALKTSDALKKMYGFLAGLGKKATYLEPESDTPAATLEAVAGLASDLAEALGSFERETGAGLLSLLQAGSAVGDVSASSTEGDASTALADPQAAVQALLSVISTVTGAVRRVSDFAEAQLGEGGFAQGRRAVSPDMSGVIAAVAPAAALTTDAAVSATAGLGTKGSTGRVGDLASTSAEPGAVASIAPTTLSLGAEVAVAGAAVSATAGLGTKGSTGQVGDLGSASVEPDAVASIATPTLSLGAEVAAAGAAVSATAGLGTKGSTGRVGGLASTSVEPGAVASIAPATVSVGAAAAVTPDTEDPGLPIFFASIQGARSDDGNAPASQALLARVMAVAAEVSQTSGMGPLAAALAEVGAEVGVSWRSPVEPLITPEDIARAMARGGHPAGDPATTTPQGRTESGAEPSRFAAALAAQVRSAEVGDGHTRIALSPRGLGSIEVDVSTGEDGALKIVVRAENPAVLNSLRDERDLLAQALGGMDTGSLDLQSFSDRDGQEPQGQRAPIFSVRPGEDAAEGGADPRLVQTAEIGEGRLDIVT